MEPGKPPPPGNSPEDYAKLKAKFAKELESRLEIERELAHLASFAEMDPNCILETDLGAKILYQNIASQDIFPNLNTLDGDHPVLKGLADIGAEMREKKHSITHRSVHVGDLVYKQQITLIESGTRLRVYMTDVTELNRLNQMKTEFTNMVTHELRTPLASLQAGLRMVQSGMLGPLSDDQMKALSLAYSNIERLGRLINNLLDIAKIEAGRMDLKYERTHFNTFLEEVQQTFEPLARERGLEIRTQISSEAIYVYCDTDKMKQVFSNLVHNAMKFTAKGHIELSAKIEGANLLMAVCDTGPGISPTDLPKLFGKFQQVGTSSTTKEKGTGLGLSLCKAIIETHNGRIWAESTVGVGTQIYIRIPLDRREEKSPSPAPVA